jgi:predicted nucleic acid-binding protein
MVTQRQGKSPVIDACILWLETLLQKERRVYAPEITDYEIRRELRRAGKTAGIARLDALKTTAYYLPLTTDAMLLAADLWAQARNQGLATAEAKELDVDVILAAQALTLGLPATDVIVATTNVGHLARFVAADLWDNIQP